MIQADVIELSYSNTNTYLIKGKEGMLLFDTGWAGTFDAFCAELREKKQKLQEIKYIILSHFHPDHMGIAQQIADLGPGIVILKEQKSFVHFADEIIKKDPHVFFEPVKDEELIVVSGEQSRELLKTAGFCGELIYTPGHSDDSISLWLDTGYLFVGDLNPLYELDAHRGSVIEDSWNRLLKYNPGKIYYGHAKSADIVSERKNTDLYRTVMLIMKYIDKGTDLEKIHKKTGAAPEFIEDVARMYLTHQNVGVDGILDRIEIKGK